MLSMIPSDKRLRPGRGGTRRSALLLHPAVAVDHALAASEACPGSSLASPHLGKFQPGFSGCRLLRFDNVSLRRMQQAAQVLGAPSSSAFSGLLRLAPFLETSPGRFRSIMDAPRLGCHRSFLAMLMPGAAAALVAGDRSGAGSRRTAPAAPPSRPAGTLPSGRGTPLLTSFSRRASPAVDGSFIANDRLWATGGL
jgi:hypothetical protein